MKRLCSLLLVLALIGAMFVMPAAAAGIQILLDGEAIAFPDAQPFADENSRTLVPLRPVAEALGAEVEWVQEEQTAHFTKLIAEEERFEMDRDSDGTNDSYYAGYGIAFVLGSREYYAYDLIVIGDAPTGEAVIHGHFVEEMDTALVAEDGRVFAPVRYLANAFGKDVIWDGEASAVNIIEPININMHHSLVYDENGFCLIVSGVLNLTAVSPVSVTLYTEGGEPKELSFTAMTYDEVVESGLFADDEVFEYLDTSLPFFALKGEENFAGDFNFLHLRVRINVTKANGATTDQIWALN